jgi:predicted AAA+ superfamily ATPase
VKQKLVFFGSLGKQARVRCDILPISSYSELNNPLAYWKTVSGFEVDFVLGDHELAIEVKSAAQKNNRWHRYIAMEYISGQVMGGRLFSAIMN